MSSAPSASATPEPEQHRIYEGCLAAYEEGMRNFGPGRPISVAMDRVRDIIHERGFGICETGIHGHGLASLEYPALPAPRA